MKVKRWKVSLQRLQRDLWLLRLYVSLRACVIFAVVYACVDQSCMSKTTFDNYFFNHFASA